MAKTMESPEGVVLVGAYDADDRLRIRVRAVMGKMAAEAVL